MATFKDHELYLVDQGFYFYLFVGVVEDMASSWVAGTCTSTARALAAPPLSPLPPVPLLRGARSMQQGVSGGKLGGFDRWRRGPRSS